MPALKAHEIPLPVDSPVRKTMPQADYEEAFSRTLPNLGAQLTSQNLIERMIHGLPRWIKLASSLKNRLLLPFGFSPISFERFTWIDLGSDHKVAIFENAPFTSHIGVSIYRESNEVVLSTRLQLHNTMGRVYLKLIKPIHKLAFQFLLNSL
ncbi:MAG: DUF2867 domain-containing protein [Pseudomonadota bacterium]